MIEMTAEAYRVCVRQFRELVASMPEAQRNDVTALCGGPEALEALCDEAGVGIGQFAAMMGLPVTTVRHLLREGLLHPMRVSGRFRFLFSTVIELRGVQQWQALGLTLEETRAFLEAQRLLGLTAQGGTTFSVHAQQLPPSADELRALRASVLARMSGAIRSLEDRHAALGAQLERARALERMVQENAFGQSGSATPPT